MSNRKTKQGTRVLKQQVTFPSQRHRRFIPMRRLRSPISGKIKPPVSVKYSTIFTFCVPQKKCTIYNARNQKGRTTKQKDYKKNYDNSLFIMNRYNFTNQSNINNNNRTDHSLVFRQEKKKRRKEQNSHQKSKNPDFKTWRQNQKNPLKRAVMIKKLKPHMVTGQFRSRSCQLSRVQLMNPGVSRLHFLAPPSTSYQRHKMRRSEAQRHSVGRLSSAKVFEKTQTNLIPPTSVFIAEWG